MKTNAATQARSPFEDFLRSLCPTGTAKHVARLLGISHRTVEGWLQGRPIPYAMKIRLSQYSVDAERDFFRLVQEGREMFIAAGLAPPALAGDLLEPGGPVAAPSESRDPEAARAAADPPGAVS